jgi:hypothetical protein
LKPNEVFVYGANLLGVHGAGAAKQALKWGAVYGRFGLVGQTYGIPTKDKNIETLPLTEIQRHVDTFEVVVRGRKDLTFLLTSIGTGLAGYTVQEIAPLFANFIYFKNVVWPEEFVSELQKPYSNLVC